jgi:hypothetical protein
MLSYCNQSKGTGTFNVDVQESFVGDVFSKQHMPKTNLHRSEDEIIVFSLSDVGW